jgi:hypothetical protein
MLTGMLMGIRELGFDPHFNDVDLRGAGNVPDFSPLFLCV